MRLPNARGYVPPIPPIQQEIIDYLDGKTEPSPHDLLCFVGMIEGGEADYCDFKAVGGQSLVDAVFDAAHPESKPNSNSFTEPLTKARHDATFLVTDLQDAHRNATPIAEIILLDLIGDAQQLAIRLERLAGACEAE